MKNILCAIKKQFPNIWAQYENELNNTSREDEMNTVWSTFVQGIGTLYETRSLRFSDIFKEKSDCGE